MNPSFAAVPVLDPELPPPEELAAELAHLDGLVFLDSSSAGVDAVENAGGRFSVLTACPVRVLSGSLYDEADLRHLADFYLSRQQQVAGGPDLGFPHAGLYGYVTYEGRFHFGEYHDVMVFDHQAERWYEVGRLSRRRRPCRKEGKTWVPVDGRSGVSREHYEAMVRRAQDYIAAGDIYQVNLAHRFEARFPAGNDPWELYQRLRRISPAPYAAYIDSGDITVLSSSPEQFLSISGQSIQTRPIKGTRPRFRDRDLDEKSAYDLLTSTKEVSELIMITDLERNDLGQICEYGTVEATELLKLERFAQVFHLVSTVRGKLRPGVDAVRALAACFPGGSITGAPKRRAREIIEELEGAPRGVYTGAIGCFGFNGESRFNIAIRTAVLERDTGMLHFHVGAGIVADSDAAMEWQETQHKAAGLLGACG